MRSYVIAVQRPEIELDVDDDKAQAVATRRRLLYMAASEEILITGYNMPFPGIGYVDHWQDTYRWVPHSYQLSL
jgi:hypothetical protein